MAKSCEFKTSEASTKAWFRSRGYIDKYLNIIDLNGFRNAMFKYTEVAKKEYGVDAGRLFKEANNGTVAIPNTKAFHLIDAKKGVFYPENMYLLGSDEMYQLDTAEVEGPLKELDDKIKLFLSNLGVRVEDVDRILNKDGEPIDAIAKADLVKKIIQVAKGEAKIDTLSEEAAHFFVEALAENDPTLKSMMDKITSYSIYDEVVQEYGDVYNNNEELLKKEAIGKLIAKRIIYKQELSDSKQKLERFDSWFKVLWSKIKKLFLNANTSSIDGFIDEFDVSAEKILKGDTKGLKTTSKQIKPGVKELFDSNPELANQVYKALGFNEELKTSLGKELEYKDPYVSEKRLKDFKQYEVLDEDGRNIGTVVIEYRGDKSVILHPKLNVTGKGYGKDLYKLISNIFNVEIQEWNEGAIASSDSAKRMWDSLEKEGLAKRVVDVEQGDNFRTLKYNKITPEQKQQALQLYSQYLDTIFPDSKVKDIVYHGTNAKFDEFFEEGLNYFTIDKTVASKAGKYGEKVKNIIPAILEIRRPFYEDSGNLSLIEYAELEDQLEKNNSDGYISLDNRMFVPQTSEQIHILGSKQDIEGFKEFVSNTESRPSATEMYQLKKGKSREEINKALDETQSSILEPTYLTEEDNRYRKAEGGTVAKRVTDKQTEKFERSVGKDRAAMINESPENIIKRDTGIALHKIAEGLMSHIVNGTAKPGLSVKLKGKDKTVTISQAIYDKLEEQVKAIHTQIIETQNAIDPSQKPTIRLENRVYSEQDDLAGSMDLVALYSDGRASVFDYKFLNLAEDKGKITDFAKQKLFNKEDSYGLQMSEYKRILMDVYGVKGFIHTRVVPMNVRFAWDKKTNTMTDKVLGLNTTLDQIPLADELTQDKRLNELLEKLFGVKAGLLKEIKTSENPDLVRIRLRNVSEAIKEIQLKQNISYIINEISSLSNNIHSRRSIEDKTNKDYLTTDELIEYNNYFKIYADLIKYTRDALAKLKKENKEEYDKIEDSLTEAVVKAQIAKDTIYNKIKERIAAKAEGSGIKNALDPQVEGGSTFGNVLRYLSEWNHPVFKMLWKFVKEKQDNTRNRSNEVITKLEEKTEALKAWGKSKGLSGVRIYDLIINSETGDLVRRFSKEFKTEQEEQRSKKNVKWFRENFKQTEEDKKKFEEAKKKQFEFYDKMFAYKGAEFIDALKQNWLTTHDLANDEAWLNKYSYKTVTDVTKWESEEYKTLKQAGNEAALDYYNFYTETNKELAKILPVKISANFVANIHKDMVDAISENGIDGISGMGKGLMHSLEVREEDKAFSIVDPVTGELKFQVPVLYLNPIRDNNGRIDTAAKSRDLSKSLVLFTQMAYNYKYSNDMRDDILSLRELLVNEEQIITDKYGRISTDPITKQPTKGVGNKLNLEAFDGFVNYYFGGKKIQSKDTIVNIDGYQISRDKIILGVMNWFSVKSLAFNPVSIFANAVGTRANIYFTAIKGAYFTKEQMRNTYGLFAKQDPKYLASANYFDIGQEDLTMKKANKLSASTLGRLLTNENFYVGQRKAEEAIDRNLTVSMMQNYGLAPDGKVKKLSQLPKDTKSLWELASFDEKTGYKIEGMSEQQYNDFRRKVQYVSTTIKGNNSNEDIALYKTSMVGMLLGQFRGWMPRMIKERFGETRFNQDMEQVEMGRFRVLFGEFVSSGITQNLKLLLNDISVLDYKQNEKAARIKYEEYLNKANLTEEDVTFEEFLEVRRGQLKAAATELRMYLMVMAAIALLGGDWDDDGKADYKKYWATRKLVQIANRTQLELGFFFNPSEATTLVRSPLPISGVLIDIQKFINNTLDETRDIIMGENESRDQSPIFYNVTKFIPLVKPTADFFEVFRDSGDDYDFTTKEGDHNPQFEY